jgi:glycosyltransferase involved in cell wall biosynthesis
MKALIIAGSNSRNSGGIFNSALNLGMNLRKYSAYDIEFLMYNDEYSPEDRKHYHPLPLHDYTITGPKNFGFSTDIKKKLRSIQPNLIHAQTIWMYFSYINKRYSTKKKIPYIISPSGMLDPWQLKQSKWKKDLAMLLYEKNHLRKASCIHALCRNEYEAIRNLGLKNPVAIIPNGVYIPPENDDTPKKKMLSARRFRKKNILFLSRLHPKKGLENLLEGWALSNPDDHNWELLIAGETKNSRYLELLRTMLKKLNLSGSAHFIGNQSGEDKHLCFSEADAFILPSFSEGLPIAVLEAWSYGLPVIITPFCNLPEAVTEKASIQIDTSPESIAAGIRSLISMSDENRLQMGQNGLNLVKEKFSWEKVAFSMKEVYSWVMGETNKPAFVH